MTQTFRDLLGIEVDQKADGKATLRFEACDEHLNEGGVVHGGAISTLADCAMGSAIASVFEDQQLLTVEMKINFLEPGRKGLLVADADVRREGKRFTVAEVEVRQGSSGEHIAYATATFTILD